MTMTITRISGWMDESPFRSESNDTCDDMFQVLLHFENPETIFFQIKRLDNFNNDSMSLAFQWFYYDVKTATLEALHFFSQTENAFGQQCNFHEGKLSFNNIEAIFYPAGEEDVEIALTSSKKSLPKEAWLRVLDFFFN